MGNQETKPAVETECDSKSPSSTTNNTFLPSSVNADRDGYVSQPKHIPLDARIVRCAQFLSKLSYLRDETQNLNVYNADSASMDGVLVFSNWIHKHINLADFPAFFNDIPSAMKSFEIVDFNNYERGPGGSIQVVGVLRMCLMRIDIDDAERLFVCFRGTRSDHIGDWMQSIHQSADQADTGIKGSRHAGYAELADLVNVKAFISLLSNKDVDQIVFCGHSLGGAVAKLVAINTLLKMERAERGPKKVLCVTISDPMACDENYTAGVYELISNADAIFHSLVVVGDIVPVLSTYRNATVRGVTGTVGSLVLKTVRVASSENRLVDGLLTLFERSAPACERADVNSGGEDTFAQMPAPDVTVYQRTVNSITSLYLPSYTQLGTFHLFHNGHYDCVKGPEAIKQMVAGVDSEKTFQLMLTSHSISTNYQQSELHLRFGEHGGKFVKANCLIAPSLEYRCRYMPRVDSYDVQRQAVEYQDPEDSEKGVISETRAIIHVRGDNLHPKFIKEASTHFTSPHFTNVTLAFFAPHYDHIQVEATVVAVNGTELTANWDDILLFLHPSMEPIPLMQVRTLNTLNPWENASPDEVLQTAFIHSLLQERTAGGVADQIVEPIRNLLREIENVLRVKVNGVYDEATKQNLYWAVTLTSKPDNGEGEVEPEPASPLSKSSRSGKAKFSITMHQLNAKLDQARKAVSSAVTATLKGGAVPPVAEEPFVDVPTIDSIFQISDSAVELAEAENINPEEHVNEGSLESCLEAVTPLIYFMMFQLNVQGPKLLKVEIQKKEVVAGNHVAYASGIGLILTGVAAALTGVGLPLAFASLSLAGVILTGGAITTGVVALAAGSLFVHLNKTDRVRNRTILGAASGDYRNRIHQLLTKLRDAAHEPANHHDDGVLQFQEAELIRRLKAVKNDTERLKTIFEDVSLDPTQLTAFITAVECMNKLRLRLARIRIVGVMGEHSGGKSTFLKTAYNFGEAVIGNPVRTTKTTAYIHHDSKDVVFLDFPGADEAGMQGSENLQSMITMSAIMIITNHQTQISNFISQLLSDASEKNTPVLLCVNQSDVYFMKQVRGASNDPLKPERSNNSGARLLQERFNDTKQKLNELLGLSTTDGEQYKHVCEMWMTQLNTDEVNPLLIKTFNNGRLTDNVKSIGDVKEFLAAKCYPTEKHVVKRQQLLTVYQPDSSEKMYVELDPDDD